MQFILGHPVYAEVIYPTLPSDLDLRLPFSRQRLRNSVVRLMLKDINNQHLRVQRP